MGHRVGVDIGGTFTDLQLLNEDTGELREAKVPTTPDDPAVGFVSGLRKLLGEAKLEPSDVGIVLHGTTVVTNSLLQRTFDPTGLILTKGYRTLLEYARVHVPGAFGTWLFYTPPPRVVPLENVREASERVNRDGNVLTPIDSGEIGELAGWYRERGIKSVGVSLLWSFANPSHEQEIRGVFAEVYPECDVVISSDVLPEIREYERAFTTALSAAVKPSVGAYLERVESLLAQQGIPGRLLCMKSSGGVIGAKQAGEHPVELSLSGPAAGVLGMAEICAALGYSKAITVDMGGTSTDISFIEDFKPLMSTEGEVNEYPLRVPMIDIHTIGAGGGSIAWVSAGGKPQVGPRSAGAEPGPAAYGRGGTDATLTDANLVLGRLPTALLDGAMSLDPDKANESVQRFGERLGLDVIQAALTIVELAVHNMDLAIREVSTRKGRDPRECVLIPFGGAGPGHAARLAQLLQIPTVLLPHSPGVGSTIGLLSTDIRSDFVQSVLVSTDSGQVNGAAEVHRTLSDRAWSALAHEGVPEDKRLLLTSADFRYSRQQYTINVGVQRTVAAWNEPLTPEELRQAVASFHIAHKKQTGFDYQADSSMGVELVNLRIAAIGQLTRPGVRYVEAGDGDPREALLGERPVYFESEASFVETPVFHRARLRARDAIVGPAVIEEFDSTTLVLPGQIAEVDAHGNIVLFADRS